MTSLQSSLVRVPINAFGTEAQRDLVFASSSIQQLADALGFADEANFGRFFRKHTGLTPREFRARALQTMLESVGLEVRPVR